MLFQFSQSNIGGDDRAPACACALVSTVKEEMGFVSQQQFENCTNLCRMGQHFTVFLEHMCLHTRFVDKCCHAGVTQPFDLNSTEHRHCFSSKACSNGWCRLSNVCCFAATFVVCTLVLDDITISLGGTNGSLVTVLTNVCQV